ncbi:Msa family membrane protein [Corynebacterium uterequi]|uniref:Uncharacterized protein n=1 Tax=Corynebacterium uterequi TaxID=1072256 RepID=A0A0G3HGT1_9CORY|nr:Msa family membrane protein [Corynebacterium uterequi]AKK11985.1 hypothetical protein CUTER_10085 [Corynebacterium uterequi]
MIISLVVAVIVHSFIYFTGIYWIDQIDILAFLGLIYLLPVLTNAVLTFIAAWTKKPVKVSYLLLPAISFINYIILSLTLQGDEGWAGFVNRNTVSDAGMTITVNENLLSFSQILFVALLYFIIQYVSILIVRRSK